LSSHGGDVLALLEQRKARYTDKFTLWMPHEKNKPQQMAYVSQADVLGYGGAAGGGKSDLLLGLAFTKHQKSRLFRRLYTDLDDLVQRGDDIQDGACSFVWGTKKRWEMVDGRSIQLGAVQHDKDLKKYKGRAVDFIGIDEAVDFPESYFRFLSGWLRTTIEGQKTQVVLTFNPPTDPSGEWIIQYFSPWINEADPLYPYPQGELLWYIRKDDKDVLVPNGEIVEIDGESYYPQSRTFIRATVQDNPYLMQDSQYLTQLNTLPEPLRSQLKDGNFTISLADDRWQCIPTEWILQAEARWRTQEKPKLKMRAMGVDPARGGDDTFTIAKLYGNYFDEIVEKEGVKTTDGAIGASFVLDNLDTDENPSIGVDVIGIGSSVYDHLKPTKDVKVTPINVGSGSSKTSQDGKLGFTNLRAELWWKFREALDPDSGESIALPSNRRLRQELRAPRYTVQSGKIKVESKDDIRKRIGRSTDAADAVLMAWYMATDTPPAAFAVTPIPNLYKRRNPNTERRR
jgi:hypothetical protein